MTSPGLVVAVAQFAPVADAVANLASIRSLVQSAARRGANLVVFPEYASYFSGALGQDFVDNAEALDGPFITGIASLATEFGVHVVVGLVERIDEPHRFSNTLVAIGPAGTCLASYRKLHLYDAFGDRESAWVREGEIEQPEVFEAGDFVVGLQTCYDLRFPEITRRLADAGATLVLVPSEWVRGPLKEHHWRTLVTARALENTLFVAAADHTPPIGVGNSMIVDPMGVTLAGLGESVGVALAELDAGRVDAVRTVNPALALRRFQTIPR